MSGRFADKVAFVTGASGGIGRATAVAFAREPLPVSCDVTQAQDIRGALNAGVEQFGSLDIAFNNAGVEQPVKPVTQIGDDEWDRLVAVNLRGALVSMKHEIGIIDTEMMRRFTGGTDEGRASVIAQEPIGRMGRPEEITAAVLWLCSEQAAFTVGHAMIVDGGQTA